MCRVIFYIWNICCSVRDQFRVPSSSQGVKQKSTLSESSIKSGSRQDPLGRIRALAKTKRFASFILRFFITHSRGPIYLFTQTKLSTCSNIRNNVYVCNCIYSAVSMLLSAFLYLCCKLKKVASIHSKQIPHASLDTSRIPHCTHLQHSYKISDSPRQLAKFVLFHLYLYLYLYLLIYYRHEAFTDASSSNLDIRQRRESLVLLQVVFWNCFNWIRFIRTYGSIYHFSYSMQSI